MNIRQGVAPLLMMAVLSGCATLPGGPSVNVLPAQGKSFDTFRVEDANCRQWAEQRLGMPAQETHDTNVATGAVAGTAIGAGLGAALGSVSGHAGAGALVGAAGGLLVGTAAGSSAGQVYGHEAQRRYDNAYMQCMYAYGNQVPGYRRAAAPAPAPVAVVPPPPPQIVAAPPAPAPPPAVVSTPIAPPVVAAEQYDYPPPPEVYIEDAPQFIYSPALRMYVAVGVPYDLIYTGNDYFYFNGGRWYRGPYYNGPWTFVPRRSYPAFFSRYRINTIRRYRDVEFRRYERDRGHYEGRFHRPEYRDEHRRGH